MLDESHLHFTSSPFDRMQTIQCQLDEDRPQNGIREQQQQQRERDCKCVQTTHNMYLSVNVELTVTAQNDNIPSSKHTESYEIYFHFPPIKSMIYSKHRCCGIGGSKEYHQNPSKQYERERKRDTFSCVQEKYPNHIRIDDIPLFCFLRLCGVNRPFFRTRFATSLFTYYIWFFSVVAPSRRC